LYRTGIHFAPSAAECGGGSITSISREGAASGNIKDDPSKDYSFFFFLSSPSPLFSLFLLWLRGANEKNSSIYYIFI
jgi:hypothetical protein